MLLCIVIEVENFFYYLDWGVDCVEYVLGFRGKVRGYK